MSGDKLPPGWRIDEVKEGGFEVRNHHDEHACWAHTKGKASDLAWNQLPWTRAEHEQRERALAFVKKIASDDIGTEDFTSNTDREDYGDYFLECVKEAREIMEPTDG